jgi:adenylate cyclase
MRFHRALNSEANASVSEPSRAVFLSYASQNTEAAAHICEALRAAGVEVWFDQSELRGGDAWDQKIRHQIRDCALFVPIISAQTTLRPEGYFRLEWAIADQRTQMIAPNKVFIVPVCVDATPENTADLPDSFHRAQWTRLPAGVTPPSFCNRIINLLNEKVPAPVSSAPPVAMRAPRTYRWWILSATALVLVAGVVALRPSRWIASQFVSQSDSDRAPERSIAVLPFADMSEKKDQEYFSDGLSEELIDLLTKIPDLRVPARTSSFYFKGQHATIAEIAKSLRVSHLLEGSVRRAGDTIRVTTQLIRADNGYHIWSETFDRDAKDIFKVQDEIASRVVNELKVTLPGGVAGRSGRTDNPEAYNQYLLGRKFLNQYSAENFSHAVDSFNQAVELDPGYATAFSALAVAEGILADAIGDSAGLKRATAAAERGIALAPDSAEGYASRALLRTLFLWDWDGANADFRRALTLDPNNAGILAGYSELLGAKGQLPDAVAALDKAIEIDPLAGIWELNRGKLAIQARDLPAARLAFHRVLQLDPGSPRGNPELAIVEVLDHRPERAAEALRAASASEWRLFATALVEHSLGHSQESQKALDELVTTAARSAAFQIAEAHAWRGEKDQAFQWLDRAYAQRDGGMIRVKNDPLLDSLRADPRYKILLQKINLPE